MIGLLFLGSNILMGQQIERDNLGLKVSATGASLFMVGISMKPTAMKQYSANHHYNFTSIEMSHSQRKTQLNTLITGGILIITGIIVQNIKLKKNKKS